jgi:small conductance mechanosensitive channel
MNDNPKPIFETQTIFSLTVSRATGGQPMERLSEFLDLKQLATSAVALVPRFILAAVILFLFWVLYRATARPLRALLERSGLEPILASHIVDKIYRIGLFLFGLVTAAGQVGINVTAALAGLGVAGVAIGFAGQDLLSNVIAGFTIFMDKPFRIGDFIKVQDQFGDVTNITMRSTRIRTNRNTFVIIPNKKIIDEVVVNHSKHGETRVDVPVGIAYKESIPEARRALLEAVSGMDHVLADPAPSIVVKELGGSSVDLLVRVWISDASREVSVFYAVMETSKLALDAAGIQIPYPHLQLFWDDVQERVVRKIATVPRLVANDRSTDR